MSVYGNQPAGTYHASGLRQCLDAIDRWAKKAAAIVAEMPVDGIDTEDYDTIAFVARMDQKLLSLWEDNHGTMDASSTETQGF